MSRRRKNNTEDLELEVSKSDENSVLSRFKKLPKRKLRSTDQKGGNGKNQQLNGEHITNAEGTAVEIENIAVTDKKKSGPSHPSEPDNWRLVLDNLRKMRENSNLSADTEEEDKYQKQRNPEVYRYQVLLSLMLSSQTKDQVTDAAMKRLKIHGATIDNILNTSDEKLGELIYPVCFWKSKVKYIKKTTEILKNQYNGDIPNTVVDLCKLSGVGPKMAHLAMEMAWNQITGIPVDTHIHRVTNRLHWAKSKTPEHTEKILESWIPRELWREINQLLVDFGQQTCTAIKPKCDTCLNRSLCPFGQKNKK